MDGPTTPLDRPVGQKELDLVRESGLKAFSPRQFWQPIFDPVRIEEYAVGIARDWNTKDEASGFVGYVTRFHVLTGFMARYELAGNSEGEDQRYRINAYRVLLTRARQGIVIVVPEGDPTDHTRMPTFYDPTWILEVGRTRRTVAVGL